MISSWVQDALISFRLLVAAVIELTVEEKTTIPTTNTLANWLKKNITSISPVVCVCGGFNPSEKYSSKWVHLPQIDVKIPKIFELPPPRPVVCLWLPANPNPPVFQPPAELWPKHHDAIKSFHAVHRLNVHRSRCEPWMGYQVGWWNLINMNFLLKSMG